MVFAPRVYAPSHQSAARQIEFTTLLQAFIAADPNQRLVPDCLLPERSTLTAGVAPLPSQAYATMKGCIIPRMYSLTMAVLLPSADRCWVLDGVGCVSLQPRGPAPKTIGSASRCYTAALHAMVSRSTRPCVISAKIPTACNHWLPLCNH